VFFANNLDYASDEDSKSVLNIFFGQLGTEIEGSKYVEDAIFLVLDNGGQSVLLWKLLSPP